MDVFAISVDHKSMESAPEAAKQASPNARPDQISAREDAALSEVQVEAIDQETLKKAAQELASRFDVKVETAQDESTGRYVVRIMSSDGERLIRQMPPESALRMAAQAKQGQLRGIMDSVV
jgi:uncharacterized FlaG/YvyC family protein